MKRSTVTLLTLSMAALSHSATSLAQEVTLEEIIVTAQKREQRLIEVPVSITVGAGPSRNASSSESASLYQHCVRAIERGADVGEHGLPLIGSGDWNDGMDQVGAKGKGESVWLAFFRHEVLERFAGVARSRGDAPFADQCVAQAAELRLSMKQGA